MPVSLIKWQTAWKCSSADSGFNSTLGIQGTCDSKCRLKNLELCRFFPLLRLGKQLSRSETASWEDRSFLEHSWPEKCQTVCPWALLSKEKLEKNSKRPGIAGSRLSSRPTSAETDRTIDYPSMCQGTYHCRLLQKRQTDESEQKRGSPHFESVLTRTLQTKRREKDEWHFRRDRTQGSSMFMVPWTLCQNLGGCSKGEVDKMSRSVRRD